MYHKNIEGLTLVEVLVSVVITILVMLYGMTLFISAWRLEVDSEEYNKVIQYITNVIEKYKSNFICPHDINSGGSIERNEPDITLPSGKILKMKVRIYNEDKTVPLVVIAEWPPVASAKRNQKVERIVVNTHLGVNDNFEI